MQLYKIKRRIVRRIMNIIHENFRRFIKEAESPFNSKDFQIIYEKAPDKEPERPDNWDKMSIPEIQ